MLPATILSTARKDPADQIFSHQDDEDGTVRHYHILTLMRLVEENPQQCVLCRAPINRDFARLIHRQRGLNEEYMRRLKGAALNKPILGCQFADESVLYVDGHHRYYKRYKLGLRYVPAYLIPEEIWRQALIDLPPDYDHMALEGRRR